MLFLKLRWVLLAFDAFLVVVEMIILNHSEWKTEACLCDVTAPKKVSESRASQALLSRLFAPNFVLRALWKACMDTSLYLSSA